MSAKRRRSAEAILADLTANRADIAKLRDCFKRQNALFAEGQAAGLTNVAMAEAAGVKAEQVRQGANRHNGG